MIKKIIFLFLLLSFSAKSQELKEIYETKDFSINYPAQWELLINVEGAAFAIVSPLSSKEDSFKENINLLIGDLKGKNINLDTYVSKVKEEILQVPNRNLLESKRVKRNGIEFHTFLVEGSANGLGFSALQMYGIKDEKVYVLTFTIMKDEYQKFIKVGRNIFKSFKLK